MTRATTPPATAKTSGADPPGGTTIEYVPDGTELGRLTFSNVDSVRGGPLVAFGARSFSIRDTDGNIVFDSGSLLDREALRLGISDDTA